MLCASSWMNLTSCSTKENLQSRRAKSSREYPVKETLLRHLILSGQLALQVVLTQTPSTVVLEAKTLPSLVITTKRSLAPAVLTIRTPRLRAQQLNLWAKSKKKPKSTRTAIHLTLTTAATATTPKSSAKRPRKPREKPRKKLLLKCSSPWRQCLKLLSNLKASVKHRKPRDRSTTPWASHLSSSPWWTC